MDRKDFEALLYLCESLEQDKKVLKSKHINAMRNKEALLKDLLRLPREDQVELIKVELDMITLDIQ